MPAELLVRHRFTVNAHSFFHRDEMRGGVETCRETVGPENALEHGGGRALAVGSHDEDGPKVVLWVGQFFENVFEAVELRSNPTGRSAEEAQRRSDRHLPRVALSSGRGTTMSSMPCSRRNSER